MELTLRLSIVVPCYNVEKYCRPVIEQILPQCTSLILIDDGSTDQTPKILQEFQSKDKEKVHLITFSENKGKGVALLKGFQYALNHISFDTLLTIDSDGQHLPSEIPAIATCVAKGADFVIGSRNFKHAPFIRRLPNLIISFLLHRLFPKAPIDTQSGYRAFNKTVVQKFEKEIYGDRYELEFRCLLLALRDNLKIEECPIKTIYHKKNSSSHFSAIKDSALILHVFFNYWRSKRI